MKRKILALSLALVMCLTIMAIPATAADEDVVYTDTRGNKITIPGGAKSCATKVINFTPGNPWTSDERAMNPEKVLGVPDYDSAADTNYLCLGAFGSITLEFSINIIDGPGIDIYVFEVGGNVEATKVEVSNDLVNWIYVGDADGSLSGVDLNGKVPAGASYKYVRITDRDGASGDWPGADIDAVAGLNAKVPPQGSSWASAELEKADALGLIPDSLKSADLTKPITRAEFAAIAVKVYESLTGEKTTPSAGGTFTDTKDTEVLKAHNTGLMMGISSAPGVPATKFEPNTILNRETAATALTRVLKRAYIPGWSFETDGNFKLNYTKPAAFADDAHISGWAKDSVYFMAANGIIKGKDAGKNLFAPKEVATAGQAVGFANATREEAIIIGLRLVENLKDKPLNFTQN